MHDLVSRSATFSFMIGCSFYFHAGVTLLVEKLLNRGFAQNASTYFYPYFHYCAMNSYEFWSCNDELSYLFVSIDYLLKSAIQIEVSWILDIFQF